MTNGFRINTGAKKIVVNDEGEYITLQFGDQSFPSRVFAFMDSCEAKQQEVSEKLNELKDDDSIENKRLIADLIKDAHVSIMNELDATFGAETCRKVFGNIVPSMDHFTQFIEAINPYFDEYAKERQKVIGKKYNKARKGNV